MLIKLETCRIRSLEEADVTSLAYFANNRKVWRNLRDAFPHPYCEEDARQFIARVKSEPRETHFSIEVDGHAVGVIGVRLQEDVEIATAELGYWLGEPYWGQGLMTSIVRAFSEHAIREFALNRLEAMVFAWNPGSARVLEKAGYRQEGLLKRSAVKDGEVIDRFLYAFVPDGTGG
ncbi:MAG: GNAT family N-acetyltransferase [Planctomycetes bacterium]|nr:GNAT family N-acetyltransferase [Planctomycetota bacterium]